MDAWAYQRSFPEGSNTRERLLGKIVGWCLMRMYFTFESVYFPGHRTNTPNYTSNTETRTPCSTPCISTLVLRTLLSIHIRPPFPVLDVLFLVQHQHKHHKHHIRTRIIHTSDFNPARPPLCTCNSIWRLCTGDQTRPPILFRFSLSRERYVLFKYPLPSHFVWSGYNRPKVDHSGPFRNAPARGANAARRRNRQGRHRRPRQRIVDTDAETGRFCSCEETPDG